MDLERLKLDVGDLEFGMYITELDRPWLDTPFPFQGFLLESQSELDKLKDLCEYVYIDSEKSSIRLDFAEDQQSHSEKEVKIVDLDDHRQTKYEKKSHWQDEHKEAGPIYERITAVYNEILSHVRNNQKINIEEIKNAINPMVDSVIRNPDAFMLLASLKKHDTYGYNHAMSCSVLCVATGRHLGLPKDSLKELALGGLLFDIGRARIDPELLAQTRHLTDDEMVIVRSHVNHSLDIVKGIEGMTDSVTDMIASHHERHNGSGYPQQLKGGEIPLFARIAGLVDCYDAITSVRPYSEPLSPQVAATRLYEWRDKDFHSSLIEQFIQVVGIYPVGTLVQLTDERIGFVVSQHLEARLKPVVMVVMDDSKKMMDRFVEVDLRKGFVVEGRALGIKCSLIASEYNINPADFFF